MGINRDKPDLWKEDISRSVDLYNSWFMSSAPKAFRDSRSATAKQVEDALVITNYLKDIAPQVLREHPEILPMLRMSTCPPIARERLIGLAQVKKSLVENMENPHGPHISPRMRPDELYAELSKISALIQKMADPDIFVWLTEDRSPGPKELERSSAIVADRLCGSVADPIIRNAQEKRQMDKISDYLSKHGYREASTGTRYDELSPGTFSFRTNVPVYVSDDRSKTVNIPVDILILPFSRRRGDLPLLIEAKSAGDFTNVNKRRKEEATKAHQLRSTFGSEVSYSLFLCGYFDSGYLGYEAAEGIDWIWEHRISDLSLLGI